MKKYLFPILAAIVLIAATVACDGSTPTPDSTPYVLVHRAEVGKIVHDGAVLSTIASMGIPLLPLWAEADMGVCYTETVLQSWAVPQRADCEALIVLDKAIE